MLASFLSMPDTPEEPLPLSHFLDYVATVPLLDARSPTEFSQGHIPGAISIPLLSDAERTIVGTLYKQHGHDKAFAMGSELVTPKMPSLLEQAHAVCQNGPDRKIALYCWRGGERSGLMAKFLTANGFSVQRLAGGYKTFRSHILTCCKTPYTLRILCGKTGSGKTAVLQALSALGAQVIDLEGLANHRGSAFGGLQGEAQPTSEHFSNLLGMHLHTLDPATPTWVEDESEKLGRVRIPHEFFLQMRNAQGILLEAPKPVRLARILAEYGSIPPPLLAQAICQIEQRLGNENCRIALKLLEKQNMTALTSLLLRYYDQGYTHQMQKRTISGVVHFSTPEQTAKELLKQTALSAAI